jgi:hypothetical protein
MGLFRTNIPISGNGTVTINSHELGFISEVEWVVGTLGGTSIATFSVQNTPSGVARTFLTLGSVSTNARYPVRVLETDNVGATLTTYTFPVLDGDLRVVTTQVSAAGAGTAIVYWFD